MVRVLDSNKALAERMSILESVQWQHSLGVRQDHEAASAYGQDISTEPDVDTSESCPIEGPKDILPSPLKKISASLGSTNGRWLAALVPSLSLLRSDSLRLHNPGQYFPESACHRSRTLQFSVYQFSKMILRITTFTTSELSIIHRD
jgi:hypothetical protein